MHLICDTVHVQRLVGPVSSIIRCFVARLLDHAQSHSRLDLKIHHGLVSVVEFYAEILADGLLVTLFHVSDLLLFQDALEDAITRGFVHVKNFVSYDSFDTFGRQMVEHVPV